MEFWIAGRTKSERVEDQDRRGNRIWTRCQLLV